MKKILIADVKSSITDLLIQFLSSHYNIETKDDGLETIIWLQQGNFPDLIIVDFNLPTMGGIELVQRVKESGYFRNIPIIVISSNDNSSNRIQCLNLGAADYVVKPYNPEDLLISIEKFLLN
jgi:DNA-binding response OmpR family regulator